MVDKFISVNLEQLDNSFFARCHKNGGVAVFDLPKSYVALSPEILSEVAVLSWRWDLDSPYGTSRNIYEAIRLAKQIGLRNLLIDVVSIDQNLTGDKLTEAIITFSKLYEFLPVIAAYDYSDPVCQDNKRVLTKGLPPSFLLAKYTAAGV